MLTKILDKILATLNDFEDEIITKEGYINSNPQLNYEVYTFVILGSQTLDKVGKRHGVVRERVRQIRNKEYDRIKTVLESINDNLSADAEKLFENFGLIAEVDNENYDKIKSYKKVFDKYYLKEKINEKFCIDIDNRIIYSNFFDLDKIKINFESRLSDDSYYTKEDLINLSLSVLSELYQNVDKISLLKYAQILYKVLINKVNEPENKREINKKHFIAFADNIYYYSKSKKDTEDEKIILDIQFLYWFKVLYPNGVQISQQNEKATKNSALAKEISLKNLEPLLAKVEQLRRKEEDYSSIYRYIVKFTKSDKIVSYDRGFYIHIDHIKDLCEKNKIYISNLSKEIYKLFNDECNCIRVYSVFKSLEKDFINSGIITHELLFNILKISDIKLFNYDSEKKLLVNLNLNGNNKIKFEDNSLRFSKEECSGIKEFLQNNTFKTIDFCVENQLKKVNVSMEDINREFENIDKETLKTETEAIVKSRIGQDKLRKELLNKSHCCELCGINLEEILVASHIKPWKDSDNNEKLDVENTLLLCAMHDALFDKGLISFGKDGKIIISKYLDENMQALLNIHDESRINNVSERKAKYLEYHLSKHKHNFY